MTFDDIPIDPCCKSMEDTIMMNDIRESITFHEDEPKGSPNRFMIVWSDGDCIPLLYCPSCGRKIRELDDPGDSGE